MAFVPVSAGAGAMLRCGTRLLRGEGPETMAEVTMGVPPEGAVDVWVGEVGGGLLRFFGWFDRNRVAVASSVPSVGTQVYQGGFRINAALGYSSEGCGAADDDSGPIFAPAAPPDDGDEGLSVLVAGLLGELSCEESGMEGAVQRLQAQQAEHSCIEPEHLTRTAGDYPIHLIFSYSHSYSCD
jgi:hypothetical protein